MTKSIAVATSATMSGLGRAGLGVLVVAVLVAAGTVLRFANIEKKVYWHDEAYSSLRTFGTTGGEYYAKMFDNGIHSVEEVRVYQRPNPDSGMADTLKALASRPEHPPLYYIAGRLWSKFFDDPAVALRSLSALFGLLLLPAAYALMRELFDDPWVSWAAAALIAVSPLHLLYSQEARQYALWTSTTALSCAIFLRCLRTGSPRSWLAYAFVTALGLYSAIMFACTTVSHLVYLILMRAEYGRERIKPFLLAASIGLAAFIPWLAVLFSSRDDVAVVTGWMRQAAAKSELTWNWLVSVNRLFFDFPGSEYLVPVSVSLGAYSIFVLVRKSPRRSWLLLILLLAISGGAVLLPDLLAGGRRSMGTRYLLPALLSIHLCVAFAIGRAIKPGAKYALPMRVFATVLVVGGVYSQMTIVSSDKWWNKYQSDTNAEIAAIVNSSDKPLLISTLGDINPGEIMSMSRHLEDKVHLLLLDAKSDPEIPSGYSRVFALNPAWHIMEAIQKNYETKYVYGHVALWELHEISR